jgi:ABC-type multidrug transport system permease subunit
MSYLVAIAFVVILGSLAAALYFMMRGGENTPSKSRRMARALAMRVGFSILLFVCILIAWKMGVIHPTGVPQGT